MNAAIIFAQPSLLWESRFHGPIANDQGNAIAVDAAGNVYVVGASDEPSGSSDYLTIKYNPAGDTLWTRRYNGSANGLDEALAIQVDASGNVYVTGRSQGAGSGYNMVTIKYNSAGVQQWAVVFSGATNSINIGYNLAVDVFGNVYVVGGNSTNSGVAIKYNSSGVFQWSRNLASFGPYQNKIFIKISPYDGNIIVTGGFNIHSTYYVYTLNPANGTIIQSHNTALITIKGIPTALELDGLGNIYVTCSFANSTSSVSRTVTTTRFNQTSQSHNWYHSTTVPGNSGTVVGVDMKMDNDFNLYIPIRWYDGANFRIIVKKLTSGGSVVWQTPWDEGIEGTPVALTLSKITSPPEIFVAGYTGLGDFKTIKYNNDGDTIWVKTYDCGSNGTDIAAAMVIDNCDNLYITGSSNCDGTFKDVKTIKYSTATPPVITPPGPITFCQGSSATLTASLAQSYEWSTGETTQSIVVSSSGNYSITTTNAEGCPAASASISVTELPPPIATITGNPSFCEGGSTVLTASIASSYQWSNGATTRSITVATAGDYYVIVTDAAGCSAVSQTTTVVELPPPPVAITASGPTTFCPGGSVILTATQANSYSWNTGDTTQNILVSATGNYSVTINDSENCPASADTSVTVTPVATLTLVPDSTTCDNEDGSIITNISGGSPIESFEWSNGATTQNIVNLPGGTYSLTVTDVNQCTVTAQATVEGKISPTVDLGPDTTVNQGQVVILNAAGPGITQYKWSTDETTPSITVTTTGTYSVTVTNSFGCMASDAIVVTVLVSTDNERDQFKITAMPNPANDVLHIKCEGRSTTSVKLLDSTGRLLIQDNSFAPDGAIRTLRLENIPAGTYFLEVGGRDFREVITIIKANN